VTDPRGLLARYLEQRAEMGESPVILDATPVKTEQGRAQPSTDQPAHRSAAPDRARPRSPASKPDWRRGAPPIPPTGIVVPAAEKDLFSTDPLNSMALDHSPPRSGNAASASCAGSEATRFRARDQPTRGWWWWGKAPGPPRTRPGDRSLGARDNS